MEHPELENKTGEGEFGCVLSMQSYEPVYHFSGTLSPVVSWRDSTCESSQRMFARPPVLKGSENFILWRKMPR